MTFPTHELTNDRSDVSQVPRHLFHDAKGASHNDEFLG